MTGSAEAGDRAEVVVIVPAYNCAGYIEEALWSVERQTLAPAEVVVVDDGSTDDTPARVKRFIARSRLKVSLFRQPNRGIAAARNLAVAHSSSGLLAFLDGDDKFYPDFLYRAAGALVAHPELILCFSDRDVVSGSGRFMRRDLDEPRFRAMRAERLADGVSVLRDNPFVTLVGGNVIPIGNLVVRRSAFGAAGAFDEEQRAVEDRPLLLRLAKLGTFGFVDEPLGTWRRHGSNTSGAGNSLRMSLYADKLLDKLLRDAGQLQLTTSELAEVRRQRSLMPARLLFAASNSADPAYPGLAVDLLRNRRTRIAAVAEASARYLWRRIGRRNISPA